MSEALNARAEHIDGQLKLALGLPTVKRVLAKQHKTVAEARRRRAAGTMTWSIDTPLRGPLVPMIIARAAGCKFYDLDGHEHIDLHLGFWTGILGHSPTVVVEAIRRELANGSTVGVGHELESELCELLIDHIECAEMCCLTNSGTEALMHAVKLARAVRRRPTVAKFDQHYHGHYDHLAVDLVEFNLGLPSRDHSLVLPRSPEAFEIIRKHREELACVVIEPGAPGRAFRASYELSFFQELRRLTSELGIILIFDEVFRGFRSRFGPALDVHGVIPDLACFGKIIGGGLPLAAVVGRRSFMELGQTTGNAARDIMTRVALMGTYPGNRISCAAGVAQLKYIKEHQKEIYPYMDEAARSLASQINAHARECKLPIEASASDGGLLVVHRSAPSDGKPPPATVGTPMDPVVLLQTYLRDHGVYFAGAPIQMSIAHRPEDVSCIAAAFKASMLDLVQDGVTN